MNPRFSSRYNTCRLDSLPVNRFKLCGLLRGMLFDKKKCTFVTLIAYLGMREVPSFVILAKDIELTSGFIFIFLLHFFSFASTIGLVILGALFRIYKRPE